MTAIWSNAERDQVRARVNALAAALPGVVAQQTRGHTGYHVRGRRFAWLLVDHHGDDRLALAVKAPAGEREALVSGDPRRYFTPAYLGARGWLGADLDPARDPDWEEVAALLEQAWRMTAPTAMVTVFDAARRGSG